MQLGDRLLLKGAEEPSWGRVQLGVHQRCLRASQDVRLDKRWISWLQSKALSELPPFSLSHSHVSCHSPPRHRLALTTLPPTPNPPPTQSVLEVKSSISWFFQGSDLLAQPDSKLTLETNCHVQYNFPLQLYHGVSNSERKDPQRTLSLSLIPIPALAS